MIELNEKMVDVACVWWLTSIRYYSLTLCKDKAVAVVHNIKPLASDVNVCRIFVYMPKKDIDLSEPLCQITDQGWEPHTNYLLVGELQERNLIFIMLYSKL